MPRTPAASRLFELLQQRPPVVGPGIYDVVSARMAEKAGFPMAFLSGYGLSASLLGEPDFGVLSGTQMLDAASRICPAVGIPIVVDIDTGWGSAFNVERAVESLVRQGAAGCFLEDQVWPKRCGHMEGKRVVDVEEYLPKLRAALAARGSTPFHVTARTDARGVLGIDEAIRRACLYRDAGADAVFVEAPLSVAELQRIRREVSDVTLVANMLEQGKTPIVSVNELEQLGYSLVAVPVAGLFAAARALEEVFTVLARDGSTRAVSERQWGFGQMNEFLGLPERYEREKAWLR